MAPQNENRLQFQSLMVKTKHPSLPEKQQKKAIRRTNHNPCHLRLLRKRLWPDSDPADPHGYLLSSVKQHTTPPGIPRVGTKKPKKGVPKP